MSKGRGHVSDRKKNYALYTDKKEFLDRLEKNVSRRLPTLNIISVTDDFYNEQEDINQRNLKLQKSIIDQEKKQQNDAFANCKKTFDFDKFSLKQIQAAYKAFKKNQDRFLISYRLMTSYLEGEQHQLAEKEKEKAFQERRRSSNVVKVFREEARAKGQDKMATRLDNP